MRFRIQGAHVSAFGVLTLFLGSLTPVDAGAAPNISALPTAVEFNRVRNNTVSSAANVVLTNSAPDGENATAVSYTFQGGAGPFVIAGQDSQINGDSQQNFDLTCEPTVPGDFTRTLRIEWTGGGNTPLDIMVHCFVPVIWIGSADPRNFGNATVGGAGDNEMFQITNDSSVTVQVSSFTKTGSGCADYTISGATILSSGQSANVSVTFAPAQRGARTCTMTVVDDVAAIPNTTLAMTGFGQAGELSIPGAPVSLNFSSRRVGSGPSAIQTFTIQNTGDLTLQITDVSIPASNSEDWVVENVAMSLGVGASTQVDVQFSPSAFATGFGAQNAIVVVTSDDPVDPDETVTVNGTGTAAILDYSENPEPDFGSSSGLASGSIGVSRTITVQNPGQLTLNVVAEGSGITGGNGIFTIASGAPPFSVPASQSAELTVLCLPTSAAMLGAQAATLNLASNADDAASPQGVALTCTGIAAEITLKDSFEEL